MIHNSRLRIISDHPLRDLAEICAERAEKRVCGAKKRFWERAEPKLENVCEGLLKLGDAERTMGRAAHALKERGLDGFAVVLGRALDLEGRAEELMAKCAGAHVAKARALANIFAFWRTNKEREELERAPNFLEEEGLPRPPRGGTVFQDASRWYGNRECGGTKYPIMNGIGAVHTFNAKHRQPE